MMELPPPKRYSERAHVFDWLFILIFFCVFCESALPKEEPSHEELLREPIESIMDRHFQFPGDDPHDYASLSIYWWPNPATKIPYIRKDGQINPEVEQYDAPRLRRMARTINKLANVYAETGDRRFAENADKRLQAWFLNKETRMNPAMRYAQFIPGLRTASYHGLIEGDILCTVFLDGISLLEAKNGLQPETLKGLREWFHEFTQWFLTSDLGKEEGSQKSNHGIWYDYQIARYAEFSGDKNLLLETLSHVGERRIAGQIKADGSLPAEMIRTKSYSYVCYALQPLLRLAEMGDKYGIDIAGYQAPSGASIAQALKFGLSNSKNPEKWPGRQIVPFDRGAIVALTNQYLKLREDAELRRLMEQFKP